MLPFLGAVRDPRPAPPLRGWPGWMTGNELRRFAVRRVTVHASPPRRTAYCVPHDDGTSRGGSKARATPRFLGAARASRCGPAAVVVARRGRTPPLAPPPCAARLPTLAAVFTRRQPSVVEPKFLCGWRRSGACLSSQGDARRRHARPTRVGYRVVCRPRRTPRGACLGGAKRKET
jgi:hypothetical protein